MPEQIGDNKNVSSNGKVTLEELIATYSARRDELLEMAGFYDSALAALNAVAAVERKRAPLGGNSWRGSVGAGALRIEARQTRALDRHSFGRRGR